MRGHYTPVCLNVGFRVVGVNLRTVRCQVQVATHNQMIFTYVVVSDCARVQYESLIIRS